MDEADTLADTDSVGVVEGLAPSTTEVVGEPDAVVVVDAAAPGGREQGAGSRTPTSAGAEGWVAQEPDAANVGAPTEDAEGVQVRSRRARPRQNAIVSTGGSGEGKPSQKRCFQKAKKP